MEPNDLVIDAANKARSAAKNLIIVNFNTKNLLLSTLAKNLIAQIPEIISANQKDIENAKQKNLAENLIDRLTLNEQRINSIIKSIEEVIKLPDPTSKKLAEFKRPNGLLIERVTTPIGVIGMIYESRPNVTIDAGILAFKSGNAIILRGGSDSFESSKKLVEIFRNSLTDLGLDPDIIQLIDSKDREVVQEMLKAVGLIDLIIPRGGEGLNRLVQEQSKVPTLLHLTGNCHVYVHQDADQDMALKVIENGKLRRTSICGATESLLIDHDIEKEFLPKIYNLLYSQNCEIVGDQEARNIVPEILAATEEDWYKEYLAAKISVKIVRNLDEAIDHINKYSSHHTDSIITSNMEAANHFLKLVDSANVMHNASTQFADGYEFGMGAEIGIATGKLHARGPVGLEQLVTYKYYVHGSGQIRP